MIILKSNIGVGIVVAIFVTLVIPGIVYLYKFLREKTGFLSDKYSELLNLKNQLSDIERQISSFKQINDTGRITREEKDEWLQLTKTHKIINDEIILIKNKKTTIKRDENSNNKIVSKSIDDQKKTERDKELQKSAIKIWESNIWFKKLGKEYIIELEEDETIIIKVKASKSSRFKDAEILGWLIVTTKRFHFYSKLREQNILKSEIKSISKYYNVRGRFGIKIETNNNIFIYYTGLWGRENLINHIKK